MNPLATCPFGLGGSCRRNAEPEVEAQPQLYAAASCGAIRPLVGSMHVSRTDSISHRQIEDSTVELRMSPHGLGPDMWIDTSVAIECVAIDNRNYGPKKIRVSATVVIPNE